MKTKYYVYSIKTDSELLKYVYISDTKDFADRLYDHSIMEFTGVMVEASTIQSAIEIYHCPRGDEGFYIADEPIDTKNKREQTGLDKKEEYKKKVEEFKKSLLNLVKSSTKLSMHTITRQIAKDFRDLNKHISELSALLKALDHSDSDITEEEIYNRVKAKMLKQFNDGFKYNKRRRD